MAESADALDLKSTQLRVRVPPRAPINNVMRIDQIVEAAHKSNPFPRSDIQCKVYHGTPESFDTFNRPGQGIYFTPWRNWAKGHYGSRVITAYVDVRKEYKATRDEVEWFYDRDYDNITELLTRLAAEGYDYIIFGGESESFVVFGNAKIANAANGKMM